MKKAFLFMLSLLAAVGVQAQTSPYTGSEVAEGEFYLYNVGTGLWIQNIDANNRRSDDNWNTGAGMGTAGFDFVLTAVDGGYKLDPKEAPNNMGWGYGDGNILYLDGNIGGNTHWDFTAVDGVSNGYKITIDDHVLAVEVVDDKAFLVNTDTENNVWQLVTKAERLEKMQTIVSEGKPYDLSALLGDWNFATNNQRRGQWIEAQDGGNNDGYPRARRWNSSHLVWNTNSYSWTQTVADLPDGLYQFSVQGMYRDGNRDQVGAKAANGETNLIAKYFIGTSEGSLMSILAEASETQGDGFATAIENTNPQLYAPDNADNWTIVWALHPDKYWNEPIKVNVRGGSVQLGVRKTERIGGDWIAMNEFKLEYVGPIDPELDQQALKDAIAAAETFNGTTSDYLASQLADALSEAKGVLEAPTASFEDYGIQANILLQVLSAAQAVDVATLKATIAVAKAEGFDTTTAEELVANAIDAAPVEAALEALRIARKIGALGDAEDIYSGSEPVAGDFYFFNIGTGMWLNQGSDWCTHAAVDQAGLLVTLEEEGAGFVLKTPWGSFNDSPYTDTGVRTVYTFQAVDGKEKVYNILEGSDLLGWNPDGKTDGKKYWNSVSNTTGADPADPNFQWKLVSKAERDLILASAKKDAPVDATYLINNPSLMRQPGYDMWSKEVNGGNGGARVSSQDDGDGNRAADYGWEVWNADNFKFYQTIEGLAPGLYEVSVQGFWREGDGGNQANIVNEGGTLNQKAYLYANDAQALLPNIASCPDFVPGVASQSSVAGNFPNWPREAFEYFETGAYKATVTAIVGDDGVLTIGVGADEKVTYGDWVVFDNFRLTYLGNNENEVSYERALNSIKDGQTYRVFTEVENTKYYLTPDGYLTDSEQKACTFTFKKVAGDEYPYGFQLLDSYFTNPPSGGNPTLANGHIATDATSKRNNWEAQVFFQNAEGKYAVRATNAPGGDSSWALNAKTFWTVNDGPKAEYSFDKNYLWQIEENVDPRPALLAEIKPITDDWAWKMQKVGGLVTDASMYSTNAWINESIGLPGLIDGDYSTYLHTTWQGGVTEAHYLQAELPNAADKFYFYFVKRDPVNNANNNNRPTDILISGSNDGTTFTDITEITEGLPSGVTPPDYMSGLVSASEAYKYIRFTVLNTNNGAKDSNGNYFFTYSEFYILPSDELFDEAASLMFTSYTDIPLEGTDNLVDRVNAVNEKLNGFFVEVPVNVVFNDVVIKTETVSQVIGQAPTIPTSFDNGLVTLSDPDVDTVTDATQEIQVTATFNGPFEFSADFDNAKWYNMDIRSGKHVGVGESEPYYPAAATAAQLGTPEYQWAFMGDPYNLVIVNKAAGAGKSLTKDGSNVVMRDGDYQWELFGNNKADGFVIREAGTENNWVNQNGGASGPLQFWNSANGRNDDGSTFRVVAVPDVVLNAPTWSVAEGTQAEPTMIPAGETLKINFTADNLEANGLAEDDVKVKVTVLVSGDVDNTMTMGSATAHSVRGETFEIPLGETDFPVALKEGYIYQVVGVMNAQLVKGEEVVATYAGASVMLRWVGIAAPIKGDTNNDGSVDVADHGVIRDNILENGDYAQDLDINEDQSVDCADLTAVVNIILYGDWQGAPDPTAGVRGLVSADVLTLNYVSNGRYALTLQSCRSYNSFQMDLDVPAGMTLVSEDAGSHTVMTSRLENGKTRVLVFSLNNAAFEGNEILYLNVAGEGTLSAENIIFADANANAVRMTLGNATGINGVDQNETNTIYDLSGRKADTMRRGVNIIRKVDGTTKKVLK